MFGSWLMLGRVTQEALEAMTDRQGKNTAEGLAEAGYDLAGFRAALRFSEEFHAYLELAGGRTTCES